LEQPLANKSATSWDGRWAIASEKQLGGEKAWTTAVEMDGCWAPLKADWTAD